MSDQLLLATIRAKSNRKNHRSSHRIAALDGLSFGSVMLVYTNLSNNTNVS